MKKKKIQLIILIVLLVLSAGSYFAVSRMDFSEEAEADETLVLHFPAEEAESISWQKKGSDELSFIRTEDGWSFADDESLNINADAVNNVLKAVCDITSSYVISSVKDNSVYGFDDPELTVKIGMKDGSEKAVYIGAENDMTGDWYLRVDGDTNVYTADTLFLNVFSSSLSDFINVSAATVSDAEDAGGLAEENSSSEN